MILAGGGKLKAFWGDGSDGALDTANYGPTGKNLLTYNQSSAEDINTNGMEAVVPGGTPTLTLTTSSAYVYSGQAAFRFWNSQSTTSLTVRTKAACRMAVTAGQTYCASGWLRMFNQNLNCNAEISWYDTNGAVISSVNGTGTTSGGQISLSSTWVQVSYAATAPAGAVSATMGLRILNISGNSEGYVDNLQFEQGVTSPTAWEPGWSVTLGVPTQDVSTVLKQYSSIRIREGHTLRPAARCRGVFMFVKGNVTIEGTISLNSAAALSSLTDVEPGVIPLNATRLLHPGKIADATDRNQFIAILGGPGGRGGNSGWVYGTDTGGGKPNASPGLGGAGGAPTWFGGGAGGGGGGGSSAVGRTYSTTASGGNGGNGGQPYDPSGVRTGAGGAAVTRSTSMSSGGQNGSPGGGGGSGSVSFFNDGSSAATSGAGGTGPGGGGGGAVCTSTGGLNATNGSPGMAYGGGALHLFVGGTYSNTGFITARGGRGGAGGYGNTQAAYGDANGGGGGGGGGGGIIFVGSPNPITIGTTSVLGGPGGPSAGPNNNTGYSSFGVDHGFSASEYGVTGETGVVITRQIAA